MKHRKSCAKLGRTKSHKRCMMANMLKAMIMNGRVVTTLGKGKELRRFADHMITIAKENTLHARRRVVADLMISFNSLTPKEARAAKGGKPEAYNSDRRVVKELFNTLAPRFANRSGGYTRLIHMQHRVGDNAETCLLEYLPE